MIFFLYSCDTVEEVYLYDKDDPEYAELLAMQAAKCVSDANIFDALEGAGDFEGGDFLNRIYKITQDTQNARTIYVKVTGVTATEMTLKFNSSDDSLDKVVLFEASDHNTLMDELKIMACTPDYDGNFSASGLSSNDSMTLKWSKETIVVKDDDDSDDEPEEYDRRTDTYTFDNDYPLLFFYYNATKVSKVKDDKDSDDIKSSTSKITIKDVTDEDECKSSNDDFNSSCEFGHTTPLCSVTIETGLYSSNRFSDEILKMPDTDCKTLESATL